MIESCLKICSSASNHSSNSIQSNPIQSNPIHINSFYPAFKVWFEDSIICNFRPMRPDLSSQTELPYFSQYVSYEKWSAGCETSCWNIKHHHHQTDHQNIVGTHPVCQKIGSICPICILAFLFVSIDSVITLIHRICNMADIFNYS